MTGIARSLAEWAHGFVADEADFAIADRALADTVAVTLAARDHAIRDISATQPEASHWATMGHVLDFDDLHMESTTHISVVIVPTVLAAGGDAHAYIAGAGVMARLGAALGWNHYESGWHATCTAGAPAAAVAAAVAWGASVDQLEMAIALSIPAAGGVQQAFGTQAKSLQVGFAAEAGSRAARLAMMGATADSRAVDQWFELVGGATGTLDVSGRGVPGGLAIKLYPCCYAMQRPIEATARALEGVSLDSVDRITVTTPDQTLVPLIHAHPVTGLEGKFSLEYSVATAALDSFPGFGAFTDAAVQRPEAVTLMSLVTTQRGPSHRLGLLEGECTVDVHLRDGSINSVTVALPGGAPDLPPTPKQLTQKFASCGDDVPALVSHLDWPTAAELLREQLPTAPR